MNGLRSFLAAFSVTGGTELPTDQLKGLIVTFEGNAHTVQTRRWGHPGRHSEDRSVEVTEDHRRQYDRGP